MSSITLGSNIASLSAQRRLGESTDSLSRTFERLSSGQRINRASDDAAGLAIASSLSAKNRVFNQGVRNFNDGVGLLSIADATLDRLSSLVIRLQELAEQAASTGYGVKQRKSLDAEAQALAGEYFRIERSTVFNGRGLFFAEFGKLRLQGGWGTSGGIESELGGAIGTGTFQGQTTYVAETGLPNASSCGVQLGDLNGDGLLDLVTAGYENVGAGGASFVTTRLGLGNGTFGAALSLSVEGARSLALGDLNGDGLLDLATAGTTGGAGRATVRLGRGDGSFAGSVTYATETGGSAAIAIGDLNGDGALDLVTAGVGGGLSRVTVRVGLGNGSFGAATSYSEAYLFGASALALGDVNRDGILDIVTGDNGGTTGIAAVRLGQGDGRFSAAAQYGVNAVIPQGVTLGDLNNDGVLDLVTTGRDIFSGGGYAHARLGRSDGTFGAAVSFVMEAATSNAIALGDLNGDGLLDLVTSGTGSGGKATIRLGRGDGAFGAAISNSAETSSSNALALGDVNLDGVLDLVTAGFDGMNGSVIVRLAATTSGISPLLPFRLTSRADALQALSEFDHALDRLTVQRGVIGAFQSRITVAGHVLRASADNSQTAAARIKDADIAQESASLVRTQILQQAASAVLAQANQAPALAIRLLST